MAVESGFQIGFKVRDYECDMQGIVNNSVYQNYLEHARHEYLLSCGLSFPELGRQGVDLVVTRAELDYRAPLRSGDEFRVSVRIEPNGRLRFDFLQQVVRSGDNRVMLDARITGVALNERGRPFRPVTVWERLLTGSR